MVEISILSLEFLGISGEFLSPWIASGTVLRKHDDFSGALHRLETGSHESLLSAKCCVMPGRKRWRLMMPSALKFREDCDEQAECCHRAKDAKDDDVFAIIAH